MNPFVTCLCITRNRREWLPKAIACFQSQTYESREMLILSDGESVADLIPKDPRIRNIHVLPPDTIGEKRNLGCALALGDVIATFDDDDYSSSERLSDQMMRMERSHKAVVAYSHMKFTDGDRWWLYSGLPSIGIGTSLCFRRDWWQHHPFRHEQIAEDNAFVSEAYRHLEFVSSFACDDKPQAGLQAADLMYATIHAGNTSPRDLAGQSDAAARQCGYQLLN